jgi:hypothetical protein
VIEDRLISGLTSKPRKRYESMETLTNQSYAIARIREIIRLDLNTAEVEELSHLDLPAARALALNEIRFIFNCLERIEFLQTGKFGKVDLKGLRLANNMENYYNNVVDKKLNFLEYSLRVRFEAGEEK